ncbi:MAG: signal peptidase I [Candidatus Woesearchaeota archaeon]
MKKNLLRRFWDFIWNDNSLLSWVVSIFLTLFLIYFVIYPGASLILDSDYPVVAIISTSMEHSLNSNDNGYFMCGVLFQRYFRPDFDRWWSICGDWYEEEVNISKSDFKEFRFKNGLYKGDIIVSSGKNASVGDVIIFRANSPIPIIHRVVDIFEEDGERFFVAKGDNNPDVNEGIGEHKIHEDNVLGIAKMRIPYLGYVRIIFSNTINFIVSFIS